MKTQKYRISYIPQVPMAPFEREYDDFETAKAVLNAVIDFSIFEFENRVKPDYSDAAFFEVLVDGEWETLDDEEWVVER